MKNEFSKNYQAIFELLPESLLMFNEKGFVLDANSRIMDWVGFTKKEVLGKHISKLEFLTEQGRTVATEKFLNRISGKEIPGYDLEFQAKNGEKRYGFVKGAVITDEKGKAKATIIMASDTTKQHQIEDALMMSEEKFNLLFNDSRDIICIVDSAKNFLNVNEKFAKSCSVKHSLIGESSENIKHCQILTDESSEEVQKILSKIFNGEENSDRIVLEGEKIGNRTQYFEFMAIPFRREGNTLAALIVLKNITEQKEAEDKILESETRYRLIAENTSELICVLDFSLEPKFKYVSSSYKRILGYEKEELIGKSVFGFLKNEDIKKISGLIQEYEPQIEARTFANDDIPERFEYQFVDKAGNWHFFEGVANSVNDEIIVISQDISSRKMVEALKTEFVSIASHQLRTPLTGIKWSIDILQKQKYGNLNSKQLNLIGQIVNSNNKMIKLVNDLLDVSRIESGQKFIIEKNKFNISKLFEESINQNLPRISELNLKIENNMPKNATVMADELKIKQVIDNLISNAVKFSRPKKDLVLDLEKREGKYVFSIKDYGIGVPYNQQDQIFEKFFRADNAAKEHSKGSGLGLYIAKSIIDIHGGKIWFKSVPEKGTTFYFSLPR